MEQIPKFLIYMIYAAFLGVLMLLIVPKSKIRELALPAIIYGAFFDFTAIIIMNLIGTASYQNYGPFGVGILPLFPPISWTAFFILYLYILPTKKPWYYIFPVIVAGFSTFFANILKNLDIFVLNYSNFILPFLVYLSWNSIAAWSYLKYFKNTSLYQSNHSSNKKRKRIKLIRDIK